MAKIGYARVSTLKQDLNEQITELEKFGCMKIFSSKHSGKAQENKEQLDELLNYIREGDIVVVTKLDRLGRSLSQCLKIIDMLIEKNRFYLLESRDRHHNTQRPDGNCNDSATGFIR